MKKKRAFFLPGSPSTSPPVRCTVFTIWSWASNFLAINFRASWWPAASYPLAIYWPSTGHQSLILREFGKKRPKRGHFNKTTPMNNRVWWPPESDSYQWKMTTIIICSPASNQISLTVSKKWLLSPEPRTFRILLAQCFLRICSLVYPLFDDNKDYALYNNF